MDGRQSDSFIVPMRLGNASGGKGATCYQIGEMLACLHQKAKGFWVSLVKSF